MNKRKNQLVVVLLVTCVCVMAQDMKFNLKLGGGTVAAPLRTENYDVNGNLLRIDTQNKQKAQFAVEANYLVCPNLHVGVYASYARLFQLQKLYDEVLLDPETGAEYHSFSFSGGGHTNAFTYGLNFNYQLLPLFTHTDNLRLQVYTIGRLGMVTETWTNYNETGTRHFFEAGAGLGVAYYFTKHVGIFGEALGGRFYNSWYNWRAGLSIRF